MGKIWGDRPINGAKSKRDIAVTREVERQDREVWLWNGIGHEEVKEMNGTGERGEVAV